MLPALEDKSIFSVVIFFWYIWKIGKLHEGCLFQTWKKSKFFKSPLGKNTLQKYPKIVASFLKLKEPKQYTGHAWKSTSATALANTGASQITLKRAGNWKSDKITEGYIRDSKQAKKEIAQLLSGQLVEQHISGRFWKVFIKFHFQQLFIFWLLPYFPEKFPRWYFP